MAGKRVAMACLILRLLLLSLPTRVLTAQGDSKPTFTESDAKPLLVQIVSALAEHNSRRMLGAFDLARMKDGALFRQNTESFFRQTGTIRAHYNIVQIAMDGEHRAADVAMEIEAARLDDNLPPVYKQEQLHLLFEKSATGWRIVELQPRSFFTIP